MGGNLVGRTQARDPTAKPDVGRGLLGKGDLGPAVGAVLMRTTCVRGAPRICNTRIFPNRNDKELMLVLCSVSVICRLRPMHPSKGRMK